MGEWEAWVACLEWAASQEWGEPVCQTWASLVQEWRDLAWTTLTLTETIATTKTFRISSEHRRSTGSGRRQNRNNKNKMRQILRQNAPPPPTVAGSYLIKDSIEHYHNQSLPHYRIRNMLPTVGLLRFNFGLSYRFSPRLVLGL